MLIGFGVRGLVNTEASTALAEYMRPHPTLEHRYATSLSVFERSGEGERRHKRSQELGLRRPVYTLLCTSAEQGYLC